MGFGLGLPNYVTISGDPESALGVRGRLAAIRIMGERTLIHAEISLLNRALFSAGCVWDRQPTSFPRLFIQLLPRTRDRKL